MVSLIDAEKFEVYSDLPGHQAAGGSTVPPEVAVTTLVPDIVVINKLTKDIEIWELTVPMEENIEKRNSDKMKYGHFPTDFTPLKCHLLCFEVSNKGFISDRNHNNLNHIHKFIKAGTKLSHFKQNISALALLGSFHIWNCRSDEEFVVPHFLPPPFLL